MKHLIYMLLTLLLAGGVSPAQARVSTPGISFYVLRVIYPESEKQGVTLTAYNKSQAPYLIQSTVRPVEPSSGGVNMDWQGTPAMPFIVTPPLARLESGGELTLRIRRNDVQLPADRESVFFISMKALPAQQPGGELMVMTVVSNMKLFYRPESLAKRAVAEMAPRLSFKRTGDQLTAINPTPYWLTFSRLSVGNKALDKSSLRLMVPPFGQQSYPVPAGAAGGITWQLIDEDGWDTPVSRQG